MGLTIICGIFLTRGLNDGIFRMILSIVENNVIGLNNVMIVYSVGLGNTMMFDRSCPKTSLDIVVVSPTNN